MVVSSALRFVVASVWSIPLVPSNNLFVGGLTPIKRLYPEALPSYNAYMHEENPYKDNPPDFASIAQSYPEIRPFIGKNSDGTVYYKWSEPNATK